VAGGFADIARAAIRASVVEKLLGSRPAVVLERIARGGGATRWYWLTTVDDLQGLCDKLSPGSVISFYFDERIKYTPLDDEVTVRILDIAAATGDALHDLAGKQLGRPSYHLLGGARRSHLTPYATIYAGAIRDRSLSQMMDATLALMDKALRLGFRAVKMEVVFEHLATDRDLVSCIREGRAAVGDDIELLVDFGYRWTDWRDACWTLRHAEDSRIWLAEAALPHGDLESHARLAARVETRVGGGEFATTFEECRAWL
jgi:Enolase C-terminal domain-like